MVAFNVEISAETLPTGITEVTCRSEVQGYVTSVVCIDCVVSCRVVVTGMLCAWIVIGVNLFASLSTNDLDLITG